MTTVEEIRELSAQETARVLHRSPEWVVSHARELGGYQDRPGARWRFNPRGIARWQDRQVAE